MNYDFDSILQRMKDRLQGSVSAMEGTFTGDILQAVAGAHLESGDGLGDPARLYLLGTGRMAGRRLR